MRSEPPLGHRLLGCTPVTFALAVNVGSNVKVTVGKESSGEVEEALRDSGNAWAPSKALSWGEGVPTLHTTAVAFDDRTMQGAVPKRALMDMALVPKPLPRMVTTGPPARPPMEGLSPDRPTTVATAVKLGWKPQPKGSTQTHSVKVAGGMEGGNVHAIDSSYVVAVALLADTVGDAQAMRTPAASNSMLALLAAPTAVATSTPP